MVKCLSVMTVARLLCASLLVFVLATDVRAANSELIITRNNSPDPSVIPGLQSMMDAGFKVYYIGDLSGLQGWAVIKGEKIVTAYTSANDKTFILGTAFAPDGHNLSSEAYLLAAQRNKELADVLQRQLQIIAKGPAAIGAPIATEDTSAPSSQLSSSPAQQPPGATSAKGGAGLGERLLSDMTFVGGVTLGSKTAPVVHMIMDPNCPHCKATWKKLRDYVFKNTIAVHVIPIGGSSNEAEKEAGMLYQVSDPLTAWDKQMSGDKSALAGSPDQNSMAMVHRAISLVDAWHLDLTPFIVYKSKSGQVKIIKGEPEHPEELINDLVP